MYGQLSTTAATSYTASSDGHPKMVSHSSELDKNTLNLFDILVTILLPMINAVNRFDTKKHNLSEERKM